MGKVYARTTYFPTDRLCGAHKYYAYAPIDSERCDFCHYSHANCGTQQNCIPRSFHNFLDFFEESNCCSLLAAPCTRLLIA